MKKNREQSSQGPRNSKEVWRSLGLSLLGGGLLYVAFPPVGWSIAAYIALIPWFVLIERKEGLRRIEYFWLWLASSLLWLGLLQGIRLAYWALIFGWLALSLYMAIYLPLFVGLTRVAYHQLRMPLAVAAPIVWAGGELIRSYLFTGFAGCLLAHTQVDYPSTLQIADQLGAYGVSGMIVLAAVAIYRMSVGAFMRWQTWLLEGGMAAFLCVLWLGYGHWMILQADFAHRGQRPKVNIALIQENTPSQFESDQETAVAHWQRYLEETKRAASRFPDIDLVVWPESTFSGNIPFCEMLAVQSVPPEWQEQFGSHRELQMAMTQMEQAHQIKVQRLMQATKAVRKEDEQGRAIAPQFLLGCDALHVYDDRVERFNSAFWLAADGSLMDYYRKRHLVMFGEYIPFARQFPQLQKAIGMASLQTGTRTMACSVNGIVIVPSICFENMIPMATFSQIQELKKEGLRADILLNISNDSWFKGSSMLDHHLNCGILTAIENRRPMLVAANTGLSAWIDASGRKMAVTNRNEATSLLAQPMLFERWGLWQSVGDWPMRLVSLSWLVLIVHGWNPRYKVQTT